MRPTALRHPAFRWLLAGSTINSLGNGIAPVALAFAVLGLGGDATSLGAVVGLHGFGLEIFSVAWDYSIQANIAANKLARVNSFDAIGSFVARPIGLALTGPVSVLVGYRHWLPWSAW